MKDRGIEVQRKQVFYCYKIYKCTCIIWVIPEYFLCYRNMIFGSTGIRYGMWHACMFWKIIFNVNSFVSFFVIIMNVFVAGLGVVRLIKMSNDAVLNISVLIILELNQ